MDRSKSKLVTKPRSNIWNYFKTKNVQGKTMYLCKFCNTPYTKNATRLTRHLVNCLICPVGVKELFEKKQKKSSSAASRPTTLSSSIRGYLPNMENNGYSHYNIPKKSKDNENGIHTHNSSRPKRRCTRKSIVENEDSFDSNSDNTFTPNGAGRDKKKILLSQGKDAFGLGIYQCSLCSFQTPFKNKLKRHFAACLKDIRHFRGKYRYTVTTGAIFRCEYCSFETSTLKKLKSHKESHAKLLAAGLIECTHCNLTFFTVNECKKHMNISVGVEGDKNNPLICLKCQRQAESQMQLVVHMALDHVNPKCTFTCFKPDCGFETGRKDELKGHLMDTHKLGESLFHPLTDACSEEQQASFTDSKCPYEINLTAHDSKAPFRCPWSKCEASFMHKRSLRRHWNMMHRMGATGGTAVPSDRGWDRDGPLLSCRDCAHKSQTEFQMLVHRAMHHLPRGQKRFGCPLSECFFTTLYKPSIQRHLKELHKVGEEDFRDYWVEQVESNEAEDVVEQLDVDFEDLDEVSVVDCDYEGTSLSTKYHCTVYNCGLCLFTTNYKKLFWMHQNKVHHKRQCDICKKTVWGKYQWFWHNYSVHNRQRRTEIYQWWLRCDLCSYEGPTKSSYKHGATHKLPRVMFLTLFGNAPADYVTFHYAEHEEPRGEEVNEVCVAPSTMKVVDITMSDEEEDVAKTLQLLGTEETITVEFVDDSDVEAETQSNSSDRNIHNPPNHDNDHLIEESESLKCKGCHFKTRDAALLKVHGVQVHERGRTVRTNQYRCPQDACPYETNYLTYLMTHLKNKHKYNTSDLWKNEAPGSTWKMKRKVKRKRGAGNVREPGQKRATRVITRTDPDHHQVSKRKAQDPKLSADPGRNHMHFDTNKKHLQEPPKWRLKCSHCPFETLLKRAAHRHGAQHYHVPQVTFHKYLNDQRRGVLRYRYPNGNLQASIRCHNVGSRPVDSYKHNIRQHMPNVEDIERRGARRAKKHVGTRLVVQNKAVTRSATRRSESPDSRPSKHLKMKDSRSNKTKNNRISIRKKKQDCVDAVTYSDGDQEEIGIESPKNRPDIETEVEHMTIDSDWICALEDDILNDDNEVIRIEVIDEKLVEAVPKAKAATLRIKCKNKGCDYICHDTDDIQNHAESCAKSLSRQSQSPEKCIDSTCETPLLDNETLQSHIRYEHLINQEARPKSNPKQIDKRHRTSEETPGRVSFRCSMCGMSIVNFKSLRRHTYVHAREEDNFDMKVRYSKYKGDTNVGTIVIKADPAYVPTRSSNVPLHDVPELEYDPELPIFACAECNFKTNKEPELTRHKNLHWSKEKAAAFDAQKWFTCGVCYFHCLDVATFKEHADKHKSRPDIKKVGKDSRIF